MGLMEPLPLQPATGTITPHPITLEGQRVGVELIPGETLAEFLARSVPEGFDDGWEVRVNGVVVPHEVMARVRPKPGALVEVRGMVKRNVLMLVAYAALTWWTMGAFAAAGAAGGTVFGLSGMAAYAATAAVYVAGGAIINKVLGPRMPDLRQPDRESVYNIGAARNRQRQYEPLALVFGTVRMAPDVISAPYMWYEGDDQYLGMVLTPGVNAYSVGPLHNGETPLLDYEGVQVFHRGYAGMAQQQIPLFSDADTISGGVLENTATWVQRTTPAGTVRIQINLEYILGDITNKGKPYNNTETVQAEYRPAGNGSWAPLVSRTFTNNDYNPKRATLVANVPGGAYDVRVRRLGNAFEDKNGRAEFQWTTMTAVQEDSADYAGIPRTGIRIKATGQLNGNPDELRFVVTSSPVPVWNGTSWVTETTSNPGAHILAFARGIKDENGRRIAGIGLPDSMIDIPALQAFMLHCEANGYTYDFVIRDPRNRQEVVDEIARAGFGQVTWAGGRLSVVWAADEQPLSGAVNMATIKRGQFQVDYTLANPADGIEATYYDADTWEAKTLRIPAPGVTTMLNPASVPLEGVTSEDHAAELGRWHLAQSLYQYKDITYSTDIEHLSYRRMSVLSLQHDMTQWGYGGRVQAAEVDGSTVTLTLDEPVPAPSSGNAFIGLRIPGEDVYRVFGVQPFTGESRTVTLAGAWPGDADLPGSTDNPAHDTLWCYDFKATPGLRCRVVAVEPEHDLKGASVAVVPEGPEFWTYVKTGEYIPAPSGSLLQTRPVASALEVTERQVVQGDTVFTELVATFAVDGPVGHTVALMSGPNGELREVAQTLTREARWRIDGPGTYTIVVRPFSPDGNAGVSASVIYTTQGADAAPVLVDLFDVQQRSGGVRLYSWGWLADTVQSADFAGVEIRYTAGAVADPDWDAMTPVGEDGFFTAPFEHTVPASGEWTFACRSRNTAGTLSTAMRIVHKELDPNLGEVIGGIDDDLIAQQAAIDQEVADRIAGDLQTAQDAADDATAKANAARDAALAAAAAAQAAVDALAADVAEIVGAPEWDVAETYEAGWLVKYDGALYRALVTTTGDQPDTSPAQWEKVGDYDSLGEAVAAALSMATQAADDIAAQVIRIDALYARMPTGTGNLATEAFVVAEAQALATEIQAEANRIDGLVARMPSGSGLLATQASVNDVASTAASATAAVANRTSTIEARMPAGSGTLGTQAGVTAAQNAAQAASDLAGGKGKVFFQSSAPPTAERLPQNLWIDTTGGNNTPKRWNGSAWVAVTDKAATDAAAAAAAALTHSQGVDARVTTVENASVARDSALGERIDVTQASLGTANLIPNPSFEAGLDRWALIGASYWDVSTSTSVSGTRCLAVSSAPGNPLRQAISEVRVPAELGDKFKLGIYVRRNGSGGPPPEARFSFRLRAYNADNSVLRNYDAGIEDRWTVYSYRYYEGEAEVTHSDVAFVTVVITVDDLTDGGWAFDDISLVRVPKSATALAQLVDITRAEVEDHGDTLAAHTAQIATHTAEIAGKASTTYVQSVEGTATAAAAAASAAQGTADNAASQASANLTAITSLQATAGDHTASINELREVSASAVGGNALINPGFEDELKGWQLVGSGAVHDDSVRSGSGSLRFMGNATGATYQVINNRREPIIAGRTYRFGGWFGRRGSTANEGATLRMRIRRYNADGSFHSFGSVISIDRGGSFGPAQHYEGTWTASSAGNDAFVTLEFVADNHTSGGWVADDVYLEPENNFDSRMAARHTVALNVNGHVSGTVSENDGETSSFAIQADRFAVVPSSSTGERLHWSDGNLRIYDSNNVLRVALGVNLP